MIDVVATERHYAAHARPVWEALPDELRGDFLETRRIERNGRPALVTSWSDVNVARRAGRTIVRMEHGVGQSYGGDKRWASHPAYPGGRGHDDVALFLAPNVQAAKRWRDAYPATPVHVIGATRLLPGPRWEGEPTLAIAWHWSAALPELTSALRHYRSGLAELARYVRVIGHGHPRSQSLPAIFRKAGIEYVPDLQDVARRATLFATDNSSTLYELALTRPVIALDAPWYRRDVRHGLRFGDALPGPEARDVEELIAIATRLAAHGETEDERYRRRDVVHDVIPYLDGASRAARLLSAWILSDRGRSGADGGDVPTSISDATRVAGTPLRAF